MIFRTQDEIKRKLNKMEPPKNIKFKIDDFTFKQDLLMQMSVNEIKGLQKDAFDSGYNQAIKEMKEYFNIKANGVHTRYEE